jgi:ribosomal protein S27E
MMQPESYSPPTYLDCPRCGKTSEIDAAAFPMTCPECRHTLSAAVECGNCRERVPYQGDPKAMTTCPKCGADPLAPSRSRLKWDGPVGSVVMLLGTLITFTLIAVTVYIMVMRFVAI